jgi:hypothetical protein
MGNIRFVSRPAHYIESGVIQQRLLAYSDAAGVSVHEFAGHRCDAVTRTVMDALRKSAGNH